jgi:hypothetical protein
MRIKNTKYKTQNIKHKYEDDDEYNITELPNSNCDTRLRGRSPFVAAKDRNPQRATRNPNPDT